MKADDISRAVMQPAVDQQAQETARIQRRKSLQAKFFLVVSTAVFSSYATYTVLRYLGSGEFQPLSLALLAVFGAVLGDRWRAA